MLAVMSKLPPANETSWGPAHSHVSHLSLSDIGSFDEEKLDEILPPGFMVNSRSSWGHVPTAEATADTRYLKTPLGEDRSPLSEQNNTIDQVENVDQCFSHDAAQAVTTHLAPPQEDEITNPMGSTQSIRHNANYYIKKDVSANPPLSSFEFIAYGNDTLMDTDTLSSSHSVGSSIATDSKKTISDESILACSNSAADGRWTREEHEAFLHGLQVYGREWKKVAQNIPTRTSSQIRSHAQKYFAKLTREEHFKNSVSVRPLTSTIVQGDTSLVSSGASVLNHSPLTPSAQALLQRILVDPEAVQQEVEDRLGRLRVRYRQLQRAMEQRQSNANGNMTRPDDSSNRSESDSHSSTDASSTQTWDRDPTRSSNMIEPIPDSHPNQGNATSEYASVDLLPASRLENTVLFHHHLRNSTSMIRRKRILPMMDTRTTSSRSNQGRDGLAPLGRNYDYASSTSPVMDGRALGNEEWIALNALLGSDLRRTSSFENHDIEMECSSSPSSEINQDQDKPKDRLSPKKRHWKDEGDIQQKKKF